MRTLDEAWDWYQASRAGARRLARLARYWTTLPWDSDSPGIVGVNRDNYLRDLSAERMDKDAVLALAGLDQLAVLVLFAVFEALVRDWVESRVRPEVTRLQDPTLQKAGADVLDTIAHGSFGRLLEPYKSPAGVDLVEQVNQVRRYRNWVAHGRRPESEPEVPIDPRAAYDRLSRFLAALRADLPTSSPAGAASSPPSAGRRP